MPRMYQIHEGDLEDLERTLPEIARALTPDLTNRLRVQLRRVKTVLSNVRWDYGPAEEAQVIGGGDGN